MQEPFLNPLAVVDIHSLMDSNSSQMSGSGQTQSPPSSKQSGKEEPEILELYDLFVNSRSTESRPVVQEAESVVDDAIIADISVRLDYLSNVPLDKQTHRYEESEITVSSSLKHVDPDQPVKTAEMIPEFIDSPESINSMPAFFVERRADSAPLLLNEEEVYESSELAYDSNQSENMPLVFDPGDLLPLAAASVRFQSFLPEEGPMTYSHKELDNAGKNRSPIWTNSIDPFDPAL